MVPVQYEEFSFFGDVMYEISKKMILEKVIMKLKSFFKRLINVILFVAGDLSIDKLFHNSDWNPIHRNRQEQKSESKRRWEQKFRHRRLQAKPDLPPEINLDRVQAHHLQEPLYQPSHYLISQALQPESWNYRNNNKNKNTTTFFSFFYFFNFIHFLYSFSYFPNILNDIYSFRWRRVSYLLTTTLS